MVLTSAYAATDRAWTRLRQLNMLPIWLALWAGVTSLAWLLPNHYFPWIGFHSDALIAASFLVGAGWLLLTARGLLPWHPIALYGLLLTLVPWLQYFLDILPFAGQAWTSSLYVLGFTLSILIGAHVQGRAPDRALDALFLAIGIAAVVSVGLQLYQWLSLSGMDLWIMPVAPHSPRPFGNLVQPNMLATFLLWGLISVAWAVATGRVRTFVGVMAAVFLLTGLALTQSRTGMLSAALFLALVIYWRKLWAEPRRAMLTATGLFVYFVASLFLVDVVSRALLHQSTFDPVKRLNGADVRLDVYRMFLDAALQRPWFGYGWSGVSTAQFAVAEHHPALQGIFQHAHNLFLDLLIWIGIPMGVVVGGLLTWCFARLFAKVQSAKDALLIMLLAALGVHAMLELPHQCAYMLLPAGLVLGALHVRVGWVATWRSTIAPVVALWAFAALAFALLVNDYLRIEADFLALRFEKAYNMKPPENPPTVLILTQLQEFISLGRIGSAAANMTPPELERLRRGADAFPSPANLYLYTAALALNGQPDVARMRMRKLSRIMDAATYEQLGRVWKQQSQRNANLAKTEWLPLAEALRPVPAR